MEYESCGEVNLYFLEGKAVHSCVSGRSCLNEICGQTANPDELENILYDWGKDERKVIIRSELSGDLEAIGAKKIVWEEMRCIASNLNQKGLNFSVQ